MAQQRVAAVANNSVNLLKLICSGAGSAMAGPNSACSMRPDGTPIERQGNFFAKDRPFTNAPQWFCRKQASKEAAGDIRQIALHFLLVFAAAHTFFQRFSIVILTRRHRQYSGDVHIGKTCFFSPYVHLRLNLGKVAL